jgi:hypothetical protein
VLFSTEISVCSTNRSDCRGMAARHLLYLADMVDHLDQDLTAIKRTLDVIAQIAQRRAK